MSESVNPQLPNHQGHQAQEPPSQVPPSQQPIPFEMATPQRWRTRALSAALATVPVQRRERLLAHRADGPLRDLEDSVASPKLVCDVLWEECLLLHKSAAGWQNTAWMLPTDTPADYYVHRAAALQLADLELHSRGLPTLWLTLLGSTPSQVRAIAQQVGLAAASLATLDLPPEESAQLLETLEPSEGKAAVDMRLLDRFPQQIPPTLIQDWRLALKDLTERQAPQALRGVLLGLATLRALWETMEPAERAVLASGALSTLSEAMEQAGVITLSTPRDAAAAMRVAVWASEQKPQSSDPEFVREGF
jgi:hypothetical protein